MTVRELIEELENYDGNMEVVMKPSNSMYVEEIQGMGKRTIRSFYGQDRNGLIILSDGQTGAV